MPNGDEIKFHLSSINLITNDITDYKTNPNISSDISFSLCNQCCLSSITALNPQNPNEICIIPWTPESMTRFSTSTETYTDFIQTKFNIDPETKDCRYLESAGFLICKQNPLQQSFNSSNIGVLEFGKIVFFRENDLILGETTETKLEISKDSDLQTCLYAGFYSTPQNGLQCIAFEEAENHFEQFCSLFNVNIDKDKNQAKFTKVATFPSYLLPSDPRFSRFILDSRMLICSYQDYTFTYIFGSLSLSESSYITASNFYSPLFQEYQKYSKIEKPNFGDRSGIFQETKNLGPSQNEVRKLLGLPKSYRFWIR
uniref:Uncharacterized protein n=1 Tax=Panagrolaimus sp. ES5 TaxID=591445 RepID=A0AC34FU66_9BILA